MGIVKYILLMLIFAVSVILGLATANKYKDRVKDLKLIRNILNILETNIKFTYKPLPQIFSEIHKDFEGSVGEIFYIAKEKMEKVTAGEAWKFAIENSKTNMSKEDLELLKNLEKLLGKTDAEGQEVEIELMKKFIDTQIEKAEEEQMKNEKLCKNLGVIFGLAAVIILA